MPDETAEEDFWLAQVVDCRADAGELEVIWFEAEPKDQLLFTRKMQHDSLPIGAVICKAALTKTGDFYKLTLKEKKRLINAVGVYDSGKLFNCFKTFC